MVCKILRSGSEGGVPLTSAVKFLMVYVSHAVNFIKRML